MPQTTKGALDLTKIFKHIADTALITIKFHRSLKQLAKTSM